MQGSNGKRVLYVLGACLLSVMMFYEFENNYFSGGNGDGTAGQAEAEQTIAGQEKDRVSAKKTAYLTFDDGPSEVTPEILDTLKQKEAKATFFLVGNEITKEREEIVKREVVEGHQVGIHTFSHKRDEMYCNEEFFFRDFNQCRERIQQVTGREVTLHRFPWGSNNGYVCPIVDRLIGKLKEENIVSFDWNVSGEDSVGPNVSKAAIYRNVTKDLEKYDEPIILLHDSNTMENTADVLTEIIDFISDKGYEFGTLDEREGYTFPESWRR